MKECWFNVYLTASGVRFRGNDHATRHEAETTGVPPHIAKPLYRVRVILKGRP